MKKREKFYILRSDCVSQNAVLNDEGRDKQRQFMQYELCAYVSNILVSLSFAFLKIFQF